MVNLRNIRCDLQNYTITLEFSAGGKPLAIYFDTPSRRFYCSVIALIIMEMKKAGRTRYVHIRRHEKIFKLLDTALSGKHVSTSTENMWAKIRMAWRNRLPDLETAALFKIADRDRVSPYEKGGKYRYRCSESECDAWANLFSFDENNTWRFRFDIDSVALGVTDVSVSFGQLRDGEAWDEFINHLAIEPPLSIPAEAIDGEPAMDVAPAKSTRRKSPTVLVFMAIVLVLAIAAAVARNTLLRPTAPAESIDLNPAVYPSAGKPSLAVLPFVNLTGDAGQEFLSDGISDQLITSLSQGPYLYVSARTTSFAFKDTSLHAPQIAAKLGVRYLVEGSVQKDADRIRINVQLIDGGSGNHVMSETFDRKLEDLFALQDEIAMRLMSFLNVEITGYTAGNLKNSRPNNTRAYEHYLRGLYYHLGRKPDDIALARQAFEKAIQIDPQFGRAYTWLANVHMDEIELRRTTRRQQTLEKAEEIVRKAVASDREYPPYGTLSRLSRLKKDTAAAISYARKGVVLSSNDSGQYYMLTQALMQGEQFSEAVEAIETALRLAPFRPVNYIVHLAWSLVGNRQYGESIPLFEEIIERSPNSLYAYLAYKGLVVAYESMGKHAEARWAVENVLRMNPEFSLEDEVGKNTFYHQGPFLQHVEKVYRRAGLDSISLEK